MLSRSFVPDIFSCYCDIDAMPYDMLKITTLCCDVLQRDDDNGCFEKFVGFLGIFDLL